MPNHSPRSNAQEITPPRRRARLSRQGILDTASHMLKESTIEDFTLAKLAKQLNAGVMSLYTYFPSREDLLNAVAEEQFRNLPPLSSEGPWQAIVLQRLHDTKRFLENHPVVLKVIFTGEHHSPTWIKEWWLPMAMLLCSQGLSNEQTAFAMNWFDNAALGLIATQMESPGRRKTIDLNFISAVAPAQQGQAAELWLAMRDVNQNAVLDFAFQQLIQGLEELINKNKNADGAAQ